MITNIDLRWATEYIEQKYIFSSFDPLNKVVPTRFSFQGTADWDSKVDGNTQIFVGVVSTSLFVGNTTSDYVDFFLDFDFETSYQTQLRRLDMNPFQTGQIRQNVFIECSWYEVGAGLGLFIPSNIAMGYIFNLIV